MIINHIPWNKLISFVYSLLWKTLYYCLFFLSHLQLLCWITMFTCISTSNWEEVKVKNFSINDASVTKFVPWRACMAKAFFIWQEKKDFLPSFFFGKKQSNNAGYQGMYELTRSYIGMYRYQFSWVLTIGVGTSLVVYFV